MLSTNVTVRINVNDENDNAPEFNSSSYKGRVSENATIGVVVARVFASDSDKVSHEKSFREILSSIKDHFNIVQRFSEQWF